MTGSKLRAEGRRRLRKQVARVVEPLPIPYVLETVAQRLELRNGWLEVRVRDGFVQHVTRARVLGVDALILPENYGEEDKRKFFDLFVRMARPFDRFIQLKFDGDRLRSVVATEEFSAAALMERKPQPSRRTQKRRVES